MNLGRSRSSGGAALGVVARGGAYPRAKFRSSSVRVPLLHSRSPVRSPLRAAAWLGRILKGGDGGGDGGGGAAGGGDDDARVAGGGAAGGGGCRWWCGSSRQ